jgi:hypothetical protein
MGTIRWIRVRVSGGSRRRSRTAVFVFTNVTPGAHTIVMKFRSNNGGSNVTVYNRIVTVTYRK